MFSTSTGWYIAHAGDIPWAFANQEEEIETILNS